MYINVVFSEFWAIEKEKNNLNMLWIMCEFNRNKKNPFQQKLAHFEVFWSQKLTACVSFWAQKLGERYYIKRSALSSKLKPNQTVMY
jgi:hypothetical protein